MLDQTLLVLGRIDLPNFLQPNAELQRLGILVEPELRDQLFRQATARTFGEQCVFAPQLHAARVGILVRPCLGGAHVALRLSLYLPPPTSNPSLPPQPRL